MLQDWQKQILKITEGEKLADVFKPKKRIINNRKSRKMENQITLSAHRIIDKFMKYAWNFSSVKIGNHYAPECLTATNCPEHLADKFTNYSKTEKSGTQGFLKLWHELDGENQELVTEWLIENYNG